MIKLTEENAVEYLCDLDGGDISEDPRPEGETIWSGGLQIKDFSSVKSIVNNGFRWVGKEKIFGMSKLDYIKNSRKLIRKGLEPE